VIQSVAVSYWLLSSCSVGDLLDDDGFDAGSDCRVKVVLCDRGETLKPTVFHLRRYQIDVVPNCSQGDCISRGLANGQREEQRSRVAAAAAVAAVAAAAVGGGSRQAAAAAFRTGHELHSSRFRLLAYQLRLLQR
jgi:hypothetical protein